MQALEKLFKLREALYEQERVLGMHNYSEIERSVLEFIVGKNQTTISAIMSHSYFNAYSLSTINRVVAKLLSLGVIKSQQAEDDKRKMHLSFCLDN